MKFADYAKIYCTAGSGGAGMAHFRREKYVPKGGPDGGDGGKGADIVLVGNKQLNTMLDLRYRKYVKAQHGKPGGTSRSSGKAGEDEILEVPLGTVAYEDGTRRLLGEITEDGERLIIAKGGKGGLGNAHFKNSTNQTPSYAQPGEEGEEIVVELELKLLADAGLVGFPNAGKSTLLSAISAAKPKVADYPFTTLEPNLGVVETSDFRSYVVADIPGIIEEASEGKGLGIQFLRHIERNNVLLYVVSAITDIKYELEALQKELKSYKPELLTKPAILVISKMDLIEDYELDQDVETDLPVIPISSATGYGMEELKEEVWKQIKRVEPES